MLCSVIDCDARKRESSKAVLAALARHLYALSTQTAGVSPA